MAGTVAAAAGRDALEGSAPARTSVPGVAPRLLQAGAGCGMGAPAAGQTAWIARLTGTAAA
jgi:hypothetical protein